MLLVQTKIGQSKIHRIGLFADQFISKDTLIWRFMSGFDQLIDKEELIELSKPSLDQFMKYAYLSTEVEKYILCFDDARFINHADNPNVMVCISTDKREIKELNIAARDINRGEEITINYDDFDRNFNIKVKNY